MHAPQLGRDVPQLFATNSLGGSAQLPQRRRQRTVTAQAVTAEAPQTVVHKQPYGRVYNFAAGPACLPLPVLEQAQAELLNWQGSGCSVMEMSHRGKAFTQIIKQAESDLRALLDIPDNYKASPVCAAVWLSYIHHMRQHLTDSFRITCQQAR